MPIKRYQRGIAGGTSKILTGDLTATVLHGLGVAPVSYEAHAIINSLGQDVYVQSVTATSIIVAIDFVQVADVNFSWIAKR